jgi:hypothetical protein
MKDILETISARELFQALFWCDHEDPIEALKLRPVSDKDKVDRLFEAVRSVAGGLDRFTASELKAIVTYKQQQKL